MDAAAYDEMREQLHTHYLMIFDRLNKELMKPAVTTVDANTMVVAATRCWRSDRRR